MNLSVRVFYDFEGGYRIDWSLLDSSAPTDNLRFTVARGPTESGPFEGVSEPLFDAFTFLDSPVPVGHEVKVFYRVQVNDVVSGETWTLPDPAVGPGQVPCKEALFRGKQFHRALRVNGRACLLFPVKKFGSICEESYDPVTYRQVKSGCSICYDRVFVGGFHAPLIIYHSYKDSAVQLARNETTTESPKIREIFLPAYPSVVPDSVLVEADGTRWRIHSVTQETYRGYPVRQSARAFIIPRSDVVYSLPATEDLTQYDAHVQTQSDEGSMKASYSRALSLFE